MEKKEAIQKVLNMIWNSQPAAKVIEAMAESEVTSTEIVEALNQPQPKSGEHFDLLCKIDGELKRVAFKDGEDKDPIGIFIRDELPYFLYLDETGMQSFPDLKDKDRLMDEKLCYLIKPIRHELNEKLSDIGKVPLRGEYWLNGHELSGIGYWTAIFRDGQLKFGQRDAEFGPRDIGYHDPTHTAKVRFIGRLDT